MPAFANNAVSALASSITAVSTTLTLTTGHGARFPSGLSTTNYCVITVQNGATFEIMHAIGRSTDVLTVLRAQEGTSAAAFASGSSVEGRVTAGALNGFLSRINDAMTNLLGINKTSGTEAVVRGQTTAGAKRWEVVVGDSATESGGDTGSNFVVRRFSDAGALLSTPLTINRASGAINVGGLSFGLSVTGTAALTGAAISLTGPTTVAGLLTSNGGVSVTTGDVAVAGAGTITTANGSITTANGNIVATNGNLNATNGSVNAAQVNVNRVALGVGFSYSDTARIVQIGTDAGSGYVNMATPHPLRLSANGVEGARVDISGRLLTGGQTTAPAGYQNVGDITMPVTGKIRGANTIAAAGAVSFTGGTVTQFRLHNVAAVTRGSVGVGYVQFANPLPTADYAVTGMAGFSGGSGDGCAFVAYNKSTTGFSFACKLIGNSTYYDCNVIDFMVVHM